MSVYDEIISGQLNGVQAGVFALSNKRPGIDTINVTVSITNNGTQDWTYGVGLTIRDSNGSMWNCWSNNSTPTSGGSEGSIDQQFVVHGTTTTHTIMNVLIPVGAVPGQLTFVVGLYKESVSPPSNQLSRFPASGWATSDSNGNGITISGQTLGTIQSVIVS